jgi:hypothetical protein
MAGESRRAIYAAIGANLAIAVTKFIAAAFSHSSAMLSEGHGQRRAAPAGHKEKPEAGRRCPSLRTR